MYRPDVFCKMGGMSVNFAIAFFVGCITLVLMTIIKIPIKQLTRFIANRLETDKEDSHVLYRRFNGIIIILTMIVSAFCYYFVLQGLGEEHFQICCSMKAGAIAVALYAAFEQWFGEV